MLVVADARETVLQILPHGGQGMEIGVWRGVFSGRILQVAKPSVLHLVDPWRRADPGFHDGAWYGATSVSQEDMDATYEAVKKKYVRAIATKKVVIHRAASTEVLRSFRDESLDFVYIDGDHAYDAVLADLKGAFRVTRPGGHICGDDYSLGSWWKDGVVRALHEFVATHAVIIRLAMGTQFVLKKLEK
ncbi:MAG TPA: class I SAM-dependent methyltransferase [Rhizomicrobium sp.]|jgi:hypothetical protein